MIGLIWAQAANGVIGRSNAIPWRIPEDMAHFRTVTAGATVLMGRRTWESLPARFRPLPGRRNLVLTRDPSFEADGAEVVRSLESALGGDVGDVWVMGGADMYARTLPRADVIELTELRDAVHGDVFAPEIGPEWVVERRDPVDGWHRSSAGPEFRWLRWVRR